MTVIKGHRAILHKDGVAIGYTESISVDITRNVDPFYEHGSPRPQALIEGNEEITGSISRAWVDWNLLDAILKTGNTALDEFNITIYSRASELGSILYLYYCKISDTSLDIPQDGFLMKDIDFRARSWVKG